MPGIHPKRKQDPGASHDGSAFKKRKEGTAGRWKTPAQKVKQAERVEMGTTLDVGDEGIWVTYARGMKGKAIREFKELCEEYGEKIYGIKAPAKEDGMKESDEDDEDEKDIESTIRQELGDMKASQKPKSRQTFSPVSVGIECVFFMKTMKPVDPDQLVRKICEDARECSDPRQRKCRYINRLTPVMDTDKATDKGIKRVAQKVLAPWFSLKDEEDEDSDSNKVAADAQPEKGTGAISYAIRHSIRNHTVFKSDAIIKMIAGMIEPEHKVNLTNPDKVILVEIFQLFCGISVVDGKQWEELKRYNINGLYGMTAEQRSGGGQQRKSNESAGSS